MIKRYTVNEVKAEDRQILGISRWCCQDDVARLESDHKAVVETKDRIIEQYEEAMNESNRFDQLLMTEKKELQNKIDELEKLNSKFYNCLESTYKYDLPKIDDLCDIAGVHKFTMLRNELEELIARGIK